MPKKDYGSCVGKCEVCTINLWECAGGKPVIFPCNIKGCPYEDASKQNLKQPHEMFSMIGSGLGQIDF